MNEPGRMALVLRQRIEAWDDRAFFWWASLAGSVLGTILFVAVLIPNLPPEDEASGNWLVLLDPFVWTFASPIIAATSALSWFLALRCLRDCDRTRAVVFVGGCVAVEIVLVTPFSGFLGWLGAYPVLAGAMFFCGDSGIPWFRKRA